MVAVPTATPVTVPAVLTLATKLMLDDQVPPGVASVSEVVALRHIDAVPVIGATLDAFTLTSIVADAEPQLLVTV